jgi:hypothetical protein
MTTVEIDVMGLDDDIQKFWDALSEPNEYGINGISLERERVDGFHAEAEMGYMPDIDTRDECFVSLFEDFSTLSIHDWRVFLR